MSLRPCATAARRLSQAGRRCSRVPVDALAPQDAEKHGRAHEPRGDLQLSSVVGTLLRHRRVEMRGLGQRLLSEFTAVQVTGRQALIERTKWVWEGCGAFFFWEKLYDKGGRVQHLEAPHVTQWEGCGSLPRRGPANGKGTGASPCRATLGSAGAAGGKTRRRPQLPASA
jgi:hypothetical protein